MSDVTPLFASIWLTFLVRSFLAYVIFWLACRVVRDPQLRFQLCFAFLGMMMLGWLGLLLDPGPPAIAASQSVASSTASSFSWPWTLHLTLPLRLAIVLSSAWWIYVTPLTLILLQFWVRSWRLRILLRGSQPPSGELQARFESLRCSTLSSPCELRLVESLRSPATTGWWNPKVLLPNDLVSKLESEQLGYALRHELMHVRRRDYLWDALATLSCYLLFFHPAAWLVRRRLRWERELVCDANVVPDSGIQRLEYADCLTTIAGWQWLAEVGPGNAIDFLSSTSLLAARVRALASPQASGYSSRKKILLGFAVAATLSVAAWIAPRIAISSVLPAAHNASTQESLNQSRPILNEPQLPVRSEQPASTRRHRVLAPEMIAPDQYSRLTPVQPVRSSSPTLSAVASSISPASYEEESHEDSPHPPVHSGLVQRFGTWTVHRVKLGVAKLGSIHRKLQ